MKSRISLMEKDQRTIRAVSVPTSQPGNTLVRVLFPCLLIIVICSLRSLADVPAIHTVPSADDLIHSAQTMASHRDLDGAIATLQRGVEMFPADQRVYLELGTWQEQRLLSDLPDASTTAIDKLRATLYATVFQPAEQAGVRDLMETYGRGVMSAADTVELKKRAADLTAQEAPILLSEYGPLALPGDPEAFSYTITDPSLPGGQSVGKGLITTQPLSVGPRFLHDPKYGANPKYDGDPIFGNWTFQNVLWGYEYNSGDRTWRLRFRVLWQDAPGEDASRADLARQVARLMLRVAGLTRIYTGLTSRFSTDGAVDIWLAEKGKLGAETFGENIYLHEVGVDRAPEEWVRELLHEYGHEVLQPVSGYTDPEVDANGRLGERLFLCWLLDNPDSRADSLPWLKAMDLINERDTRIDHLISRFAALGPESPLLQKTDANAMDGFIGLALYLDCARGSSLLAETLSKMTSPAYWGPNGFMGTLETQESATQMGDHPIVTLDLRHLPANLPLWVYLTGGTWTGTFSRTDRGVDKLGVLMDTIPCTVEPTGAFTTKTLGPGWHCITVNVDAGAPAFTTLTLTR